MFDRTWCELDAGEFRLVTDRPRDEAEDMVWRMRQFRPVAERYLPGRPNEENPPLRVVVFGDARDYRRAIAGADVAGYMLPALDESMMVVGPDPFARSEHEALLHEYVHYLLRTRTDVQIPVWFDEGLAGMLSTAEVDTESVVIGALPRDYLGNVIEEGRVGLPQVLAGVDAWRHRGARLRAFYAWSWLLTHRLLLGQDAGLADLRPALSDYLAERQPSLPAALDMSARALERSLERYLARRTPPRQTHPIPADDPNAGAEGRYRCLDDNEKTIEISLAIMPHNADEAAERLRERVAADPDTATLWVALSLAEEATGDREGAVAAAHRALALAPGDVSATVRLASALVIGCLLGADAECLERWQESAPLLRQSLREDPGRQDAIFMLGMAYLYSGRPGDALNYLRIAHRRQPWAAHVNFYLGEAYRLIGDRRNALAHLERARQWSAMELWRLLADAALDEMAG